jgi:hypothetical protein
MELAKIAIIVVAVILLYIIIRYFSKSSSSLTTLKSGTVTQVIEANTLPNNNNTSNYTYSVWFYVQDWNYRFGEPKTLLLREDQDKQPGPSIVLGGAENNIKVSVSCYPQDQTTSTESTSYVVHKCNVPNFPLQSWVNLIISLYGRTLDMYIDGKLVRTCILPGVAKVNPESNIIVTPGGGFNGWTSNFEYWDNATNPQQAYNIYKAGFGGSSMGSIFNKYKVKISLLEDNHEQSSFEI